MGRIFLIGFMGSGKSTLGKNLANSLGYTFCETDNLIEEQEQLAIPDIFKTKGEEYFRLKEHQLLYHLQLVDDCVISTGGGMPCYNNNMELLNQLGITIWLNVDEPILVDRLKNETSSRPKLVDVTNVEESIHELLVYRLKFYQKAKQEIKNPNAETLIRMVSEIIE